jgi:two-component system chemotaxis sensor kinase CheA
MTDDILKEFLAESWENLSRLDTEIVDLEKRPADKELLASIFRTIHTIKGTCGFIGLNRLGAVAHSGENVLGQMREGRLPVTPSAISMVLEAVDTIKDLLKGLEDNGEESTKDNSQLIAQLEQLADSKVSPGAQSVTEPSIPCSTIDAADAKAFCGESAVAPTAEVARQVSVAEDSMKENESAIGTELSRETPAEHDPERAANEVRKSVADLSIRVNVEVVDRLMNLVGEMVLTRNQLLQMVRGDDESKYAAPIAHLNRVTSDLQEGVMKTRMQPIGNAWSKLPRLVRDLTQQTGKQINLEMLGSETELDRTVLDAIKDPLTHMVRNSADHGVEAPAVRRAAGKPEVGKIRLNAYHEGGHVIICIEDDGAGIPIDKVRQKAIKNGLVSERDAARLSDKEVLAFVFLPGFSTAEKVTNVSGRGVGMDVVKTQIERIGGMIDLSSKPGIGTTVRIKIPLTLAIISALVVESGGLSLAIPQLGVVELVRLPAEDRHKKIERIHNKEVFRLRNRLLPLVCLDEVMGLNKVGRKTDQDVNIVVVQVGEEQFGLIVSEVFDTEEIVVKPVGQLLKGINIYQGTTILGDGRVIMILDVGGIAAQIGGLSSSSDRDGHKGERDEDAVTLTSLLVFDPGSTSLMAVPLSLVARLEEFPRKQIEHSGGRLVVQYRGDLLPLLPIEGLEQGDAPDPQPVVVFSEDGRSMGLMVSQIHDILEEHLVIRMPSQRSGVLGTAIVNGKATDIVDTRHYVVQANPDWFQKKPSQKQLRILVVDDSIFFRQLATTALETANFRVKAVDSAKKALSMLEQGDKFDLIVSDIEMPQMDGCQFAAEVQRRAFSNIPMIALTALSGPDNEKRALQAGFAGYLLKFDAKQLISAVKDACELSFVSVGLEASA